MTHDLCARATSRTRCRWPCNWRCTTPWIHRYSFIAGACLQRLGHTEPAVLMYGLACDVKPVDAASAYRLGECLITAQRPDEAKQFLQNVIDLSYGNFYYRRLQELAIKKLEDLH